MVRNPDELAEIRANIRHNPLMRDEDSGSPADLELPGYLGEAAPARGDARGALCTLDDSGGVAAPAFLFLSAREESSRFKSKASSLR